MENLKYDKGYESEEGEEDGNGSDSSAKTVKSAAQSVASSAQRCVIIAHKGSFLVDIT